MNGHDENGRFAKGNGGGPGRPRKCREEQYLALLLSECNLEDARVIIRSTVSRAKAGDKSAREWLFNYILGKPVERREISGPEGEPIDIKHHVDGDELAEALAILGLADHR